MDSDTKSEIYSDTESEVGFSFYYFYFFGNKWTTETSFISSIKYCYLQYLGGLLCNPPTRVNQINPLKAQTQ